MATTDVTSARGTRNRVAQGRQVEEITVVKGLFGVSELMSYRRALNGDLIDVSCAWILWIRPRPYC